MERQTAGARRKHGRWLRLPRFAVAGVVAGLVVSGLAGCSSSGDGAAATGTPGGTGTSAGAGAVSGSVTVFAAASLKTAFTEIGQQFHTAYPNATATFNFGGSATLAQNIVQGSPADVFAAANTTTMQTVVTAGDASGTPKLFTHNVLEIAVAPGNPQHITGLSDLTRPGLKVALCATSQPCGSAAATVQQKAGVTITPVTLAPDVSNALTDVELGEVDAALVYKTDVQSAAGKVDGVTFPESGQAVNDYPITVTAHAPNSAAAQAFVAFVLSPQGQAVLTRDGFQAA